MSTTASWRRGLAFPVRQAGGGYFASRDGLDLAWSNLMTALLVPVGSRPMRRTFGSGLHSLIFDPQIGRDSAVVDVVVRDAARTWVPYVRIDKVTVQAVKKNVQLHIAFGIAGTPPSVAIPFGPPVPSTSRSV